MCAGNRCTLTENRRSDEVLYDFYSALIKGGSRYETSIQENIEAAKRAFPARTGHARWNIVVPHTLRLKLNRIQNLAEKPKEAVFLKAGRGRGANRPQNMWVFKGQVLQAVLSSKKSGLHNGQFITVQDVGEDEVTTTDGLTLTFDFVSKFCRLTHALTLASVQGHSLQGRVRIHVHSRYTNTHLLVALSRATSHELVEVV
jgi:hypothetical protein